MWEKITSAMGIGTDGLMQMITYIYEGNLYVWGVSKEDATAGLWKCNYGEGNIQLESTAFKLKDTIATWYKALRMIALVGLLSVLVYIGIRIILSSTSAQDKAKYKNMLKDWLVAICILFMLHYIMAFMLNITDNLNNIIQSNVLERTTTGNNVDTLITNVRNKIGENLENASVGNTAGYTIMYLALVILTGVFTFQYLKRVVFMAFLTIIAPMIALTYPLDKIKDGKAQAFSYWLREYIFNCLIQPVHLLLYTVLISAAFDFAQENILYAIVALGFMVPAEKFIKNMFGMKSESPTATLGAAAGGAMVMSMLNKIKAKPPKDGADGAGSGASSNSNAVRTSSSSGVSQLGSRQQSSIQGGQQPPIQGGGQQPPIQGGGQQPPIQGGGQQPPIQGGGQQPPIQRSGQQWSPSMGQRIAQSRVGRAVGRGTQQLIKNQANALKSTGKWVGKAAKSVPGAALGATIGLAATVASGGEKAGTFVGGGALGGAALSQNLINGATNGVGTEIQKGWMGEEEYNSSKTKKEFFGSEAYRRIRENPNINQKNIRENVETFLNNGIKDEKQITEALENGISGATYATYTDAGISDAKEIVKLHNANISASTYEEFANMGIKDAGKIAKASAALSKPGRTNQEIAALAKIAQMAPKDKAKFIEFATNMRIGGRNVSDTEAEEVYNNILDLL